MRIPRFRIRTMMIAVAVVAVPLGICAERRFRFAALARYHSEVADRPGGMRIIPLHTNVYAVYDSEGNPFIVHPRKAERLMWVVQPWHRKLASKYEDAARYPWLTVEPDPPEPE